MKNPVLLIRLFFIFWLVCFVASFSLPFFMEATGDGFTRGLNRVGAFLGWQFGATVIALIGFILGIGKTRGRVSLAWLSKGPFFVQLALLAAFVGLIVFARFGGRPSTPSEPPPPTTQTTPKIDRGPIASGTAEPVIPTDSFSGIYHRGFEASHFYTSDGRGPWWAEISPEADEALAPFHVDGPGRSGGITVALKVDGYLSEKVDGLSHLGSFENRIHIVSIDSIRQLTPDEFEAVKTAFLSQRN